MKNLTPVLLWCSFCTRCWSIWIPFLDVYFTPWLGFKCNKSSPSNVFFFLNEHYDDSYLENNDACLCNKDWWIVSRRGAI